MLLEAHAKVNLGLRINGLRADGFHEIWTILQEINLTDKLILQPAPDGHVSMNCDLPELPTDETNLCLRAARLLQETTGCRRGVHLELTKRIPMGAGLGGGSSDAAVVLKGLNRFWELKLREDDLLRLAARLGSDVPFFISGGCCQATGRGEFLLRRAPVLKGFMVLVVPDVHISTAWAYKNIENYPLTSSENFIRFQRSLLDKPIPDHFHTILVNDFEPLIFDHYPQLGHLKTTLLNSGAWYASLSGSGSALYALFHEKAVALQAQQRIASLGQTWLIHL